MADTVAQPDVFLEVVDTLCAQLCEDCPARNWLGEVVLERSCLDGESTDTERAKVAVAEGRITGALSTAVFMKQRNGCEGKIEMEGCCPDCGNDAACAALAEAQMIMDEQDKEGN